MQTRIQNPILKGFNPDPAICYVDGVYYIATSTFEWFPGVQIHASKDLVNWKVVARPLNRISLLDMKGNPSSGGIWAPCLTYSKGKFYLIYTDVKSWDNSSPFKDSPNFLTTCDKIDGVWSDPLYMNSSGFDASLFHDDDGKIWYMNMEWDYRKEGTNRFTGIVIQEFDEENRCLLGEVTKIYKGTSIGLVEGPHIYKVGEFYYLMTAEGGTSYEHSVTVARSRSVLGPYQTHPNNPLVTSYEKDVYLKKAGHASMCKNNNDEWFLVHLCGRPLPGTNRCVLGRETSIQRLVWQDGWPYIASENGPCHDPQDFIEVEGNIAKLEKNEIKYTFDNNDFLNDFQTLRVPLGNLMTIEENPGYLRLYGRESLMSCHVQTVVARRQTDFSFEAETKFYCNPESFHHMAGLTYRYDEKNQYFFRVSFDEDDQKYSLGLLWADRGVFKLEEIGIDYYESITLKVVVNYDKIKFYYAIKDKFVEFPGEYDSSILSDDYVEPMGFTGAFVGMQTIDMRHQKFYADFKYFNYKEIK
ncbi:glycoside hydrolase family 43 protein [Clostridium grantii]|uniref:Xylan 1,4-beta-xylosidase n=1 Tax=Clostridium grantii DSM 8605 TaxID=1121316 RepID=A0A1M5T311_9CLOT|nr:glycoside hydrolase family 43 protein [Clostridium grantii]SHH45131.1 xylan 1,4-beta-xylosidase [Clostridium grantii DSM 8605]